MKRYPIGAFCTRSPAHEEQATLTLTLTLILTTTTSLTSQARHLVRMLRPELVTKWSRPISSDVFTFFGIHNARELNEVARAATIGLVEQRIKQFADKMAAFVVEPLNDRQLASLMHESGINVRYLGLIRLALPKHHKAKDRLLATMISRVAYVSTCVCVCNLARSCSYTHTHPSLFVVVCSSHIFQQEPAAREPACADVHC